MRGAKTVRKQVRVLLDDSRVIAGGGDAGFSGRNLQKTARARMGGWAWGGLV